jgi:hypothetical protein
VISGTLVLLVEQCVLFSCLSSGVHSISAIRFIRLQKTLTSHTGIAPPIPGRDCWVGGKVVGGEADPRVKPGGQHDTLEPLPVGIENRHHVRSW